MPTEAELLADLLDGNVDVSDVPPEVAELASLADSVREHITLVPPTDAFRESLREEVLQSAGGAGGAGGAGASATGATTTATTTAASTGGGLSAIVAGVAAAAVLATSSVAAADRAGPGDLLAGLDRGIETLQLAIADDVRAAELLVDFAAERILESVELADTAVVAEQLRTAQDLLDRALALGVAQDRDLQELTEPYVAALLTLASRTDDPAVQARVQQMLDDAGVDTSTRLVPGPGGDGAPVGDSSDGPDAGNGDDSDGTQDTTDEGDQTDDGELLDDPVDDPDEPLDGLDDPLDDPLDELDDPLEDPLDELDDVEEDVTDELQDTTDDADDLLGD